MARKPFTQSITGKVTRVIRHGHTIYGNPIMSIVLDMSEIDGIPAESVAPVTVRISDNASLVYGIENPEYREKNHTFDLTAAGRISGYVRHPECRLREGVAGHAVLH